MTDVTASLAGMRRPPLLVRAARFGAAALSRRNILTGPKGKPVANLLEEEAALNEARVTGAAAYSPTRHVEVLTAILLAATERGAA